MEFSFADGKPRPLAIAHSFFQSFGALQRGTCRRNVLKADERVGQAEVRHGEVGVQAQRLMKRPRGFNPHVGMHVGKPLIVEGLRFWRMRGYFLVELTNPRAQRHWTLQNFQRNRTGVGMSCMW